MRIIITSADHPHLSPVKLEVPPSLKLSFRALSAESELWTPDTLALKEQDKDEWNPSPAESLPQRGCEGEVSPVGAHSGGGGEVSGREEGEDGEADRGGQQEQRVRAAHGAQVVQAWGASGVNIQGSFHFQNGFHYVVGCNYS